MTAQRIAWYAGGIGIIIAIWIACLMPSPPSLPGGDKLKHVMAYFALTLWWAAGFPRRTWVLVASFAAMGVAVEAAQHLSGYRTFERLDIAANCIGVVLGAAAARWLPSGTLEWLNASPGPANSLGGPSR